ncbi:hypothetical protein LWI29_011853 [Acer saccharum]|uniref:Retroviral polymerase SH3-like domain-containing protein n=1 Tax=Acer saccharum TaxID=4024 RepID=A0AA39SSM0_ACESA|nr:hypothetical protein LWI29_011853 [Acer saccharum]
MKGYKLYDVQSKQIFISRDVVFHEEIFPFHIVVPSKHLVDPFPDLVLPVPAQYIVHTPSDISPAISDNLVDNDHLSSSHSHDSAASPAVDVHDSLEDILIGRPCRVRQPPCYLRDFHCNLISHWDIPYSSTFYPLSKALSYDSLSSSHKHFVLNVSSQYQPQFFHQAVKYPEWRFAMKAELDAMGLNNTWSITPLPPITPELHQVPMS